MDRPLDEAYFEWLCSLVVSPRLKNPARTYYHLLRILYQTEFRWFVPNDDNRSEDGKDLRHEFVELHNADPDAAWMDLECSMFELLIGLSRVLSFEAEGEARDWFWHMLTNVDLQKYNDKA